MSARKAVERDFDEARREATNREVFQRLKQRYKIVVDEASIIGRTNQPVRTAMLAQ